MAYVHPQSIDPQGKEQLLKAKDQLVSAIECFYLAREYQSQMDMELLQKLVELRGPLEIVLVKLRKLIADNGISPRMEVRNG